MNNRIYIFILCVLISGCDGSFKQEIRVQKTDMITMHEILVLSVSHFTKLDFDCDGGLGRGNLILLCSYNKNNLLGERDIIIQVSDNKNDKHIKYNLVQNTRNEFPDMGFMFRAQQTRSLDTLSKSLSIQYDWHKYQPSVFY